MAGCGHQARHGVDEPARDPDKVREELHRILAEARAAKAMPWDARRIALYRTIFPQMTGCLPEDEGAQLRYNCSCFVL